MTSWGIARGRPSMDSLDRSDREYKVTVRATGNKQVLDHLFSTRHRGQVMYNCCLSNYVSGLRGVPSHFCMSLSPAWQLCLPKTSMSIITDS